MQFVGPAQQGRDPGTLGFVELSAAGLELQNGIANEPRGTAWHQAHPLCKFLRKVNFGGPAHVECAANGRHGESVK